MAQKPRRIILLHFVLVTVRVHFGKTQKPFMFMVFGPSGHDYDSQNQLFYFRRHQDTPSSSRKIAHHLSNNLSGSIKSLVIEKFDNLWADGGPHNFEDPPNRISKILNIRAISSRKHEIEIIEEWKRQGQNNPFIFFWKSWIDEQYLSTKMRWKFGNIGWISMKKQKHKTDIWNMASISIQKHDMSIW